MEPISVGLFMSVYFAHLFPNRSTLSEGSWSQVSQAIHDCHVAVHAKGALRIATDIRIGTRVDRNIVPGEGNEGKVRRVEEILAKDENDGGT